MAWTAARATLVAILLVLGTACARSPSRGHGDAAADSTGIAGTDLMSGTCSNGVKDQYESDVDCGGSCAKCGPLKACANNSDCLTDHCSAGRCGGFVLSFAKERQIDVGAPSTGVFLVDIDGDRLLDLAVSHEKGASVLFGGGDGSFGRTLMKTAGQGPVHIAVADFDGDKILDLAVTNLVAGSVSLMRGAGPTLYWPAVDSLVGHGPRGGAVADFNHDGASDLVVGNSLDSSITVLLGGKKGFRTTTINAASPAGVMAVDLNGDHNADLIVAQSGADDVEVLVGDGLGAFTGGNIYPTGNMPVSIALGDWNGDGRTDMAVANQVSGDIVVLIGAGDGSFMSVGKLPAGLYPICIVGGDFDFDGRLDLALASRGDVTQQKAGDLRIYRGRGDGTFMTPQIQLVGQEPLAVAAGDVNGDGLLDLVVANGGSSYVSVLVNDSK